MKNNVNIVVLFLIFYLAIPRYLYGDTMEFHSYTPTAGYVPDEKTAIAIAEAVLIPIYGAENINKQKPFNVRISDDVWQISGTLPSGKLGGVFHIEISKDTSAILYVSHGR